MTDDDVVVKHQIRGDLTAVVRSYTGVFDVQHLDGQWFCSCGSAKDYCPHVDQVLLALADPVVRPAEDVRPKEDSSG
jgi:hypothetical protein